jgi:hypothetical protein
MNNVPLKAMPNAASQASVWWRLPIVWMVIGGPALVVVASFVTLALALTHPDPVLDTPVAGGKPEQPAMQARNHAATQGR